MPSQRVHRRVEKCDPTVRAALAFADVAAEGFVRNVRQAIEAHRAKARSEGAGGGDQPAPDAAVPPPKSRRSITLDQAIAGIGLKILERCRAMLEADGAYDRAKMLQRARREHRDLAARRLYKRLVRLRQPFLRNRKVGKEGAWHHLGLKGPTSRDPVVLMLQGFRVHHFLTHPQSVPPDFGPGVVFDPAAEAEILKPLCDELDDAIWDVDVGRVAVVDALCAQRRAIAAFDELYDKGARFIERTLDVAGLPTLRDLVRPGVGRRGRPPKVKPVDDHPDLVERALSRSILDLEEVERLAAGRKAEDSAVGKAATAAKADDSAVRNGVRSRQEDDSGVENGAPRDTSGDKKSDQGLHKLTASEQKSDQRPRKLAGSAQKSGQDLRKLPEGEAKSDQGLRKLPESEASPLIAALTLSPAVRECARDAWGSDLGPYRRRNRGRPAGSVPKGPREAGNSPLGRVREAASGWWRKLRRAA